MTDALEIEDIDYDCDVALPTPPTAAVVVAAPDPKPVAEAEAEPVGVMAVGDIRFGVTCTGEPLGRTHYLADSSTCGDMVMALPSSVLVAARTVVGGGVAVDMAMFLDAVIEGVSMFRAYAGIAEVASLPVWAVSRLFGTFPVLQAVYNEAMDQAVLLVEAANMRAACGVRITNTRKVTKSKDTPEGHTSESTTETLEKDVLPDPTLSKLILTSRMKGRYKDEGGVRQAVQINIVGAEAAL